MFVLAVVAGDFDLFRAAVEIAGLDLFDRDEQEKVKRATGSFQNAACMDRRGRHLLYLAAQYKRIRFVDFLLNMHVDASWEYEVIVSVIIRSAAFSATCVSYCIGFAG